VKPETQPAARSSAHRIVGGLPSAWAILISTTLFYRSRNLTPPDVIAPHVYWIKRRYTELKIGHPGGIAGAEIQAMADWVENALRTANVQSERRADTAGRTEEK
jgi:hypothetical protein